MNTSPERKNLIVGTVVILLLFGFTWRAVGFFVATFLWFWFAALGLLVLYLLKRNTKPAKVGAVLLEWNTVFLLFLPRRIREGLQELKSSEKT